MHWVGFLAKLPDGWDYYNDLEPNAIFQDAPCRIQTIISRNAPHHHLKENEVMGAISTLNFQTPRETP